MVNEEVYNSQMMNWSNWVYLGVGLLLGTGWRWLFVAKSNPNSHKYKVAAKEQQYEPELREQVKQTQLAYQMAREMSQFKAGFLARTTHELRSPLNGLIGLHQLILSDLCENPAEEREFIGQAHERTMKMLKLIDEILRVARTEHGTSKLNIQPRSLAELLQEVYDLTYMLAANRNFPFQLLSCDPEIYVLVDLLWLRQVLVSLIETAIAQMEEGTICISSGPSPTNNFVYVWLDIPAYALPNSESIDLLKSEEQPQQMDQSVARLSPGMKLLLNQTILETMGGKLEIVSLPTDKAVDQDLIRLQVSIPLLIPEAEFLA